MLRSVRDRLSVLSVTKGDVKVSATKKAIGAAGTPSAGDGSGADGATQATPNRLPELLRRLSDGDSGAVSSQILAPEYWANLVRERVAAVSPEGLDALLAPGVEAQDELDAVRIDAVELEQTRLVAHRE